MPLVAGIGPAGDVWAVNNRQYYPAALGKVDPAFSTLDCGQSVVVFFGMANTEIIAPVSAERRLGG